VAASRRLPKASDLVVSAVRQRILTERLPVGHRLPSETELMEEYGLGRVTVREALRLLERDGLIEIKRGPGGGIYVRHPDITQVSEAISLLFSVQKVTLREFIAFRQLVEPAAAALAAVHAAEEQREAILQAAEAEENQLGPVVDLHVLIGESTGNGVLSLVLQALHRPMAVHFRSDKISKRDVEVTTKAHRKIAELIAAGNAEGAERAMRRHLDAYAHYLEEVGQIDEPIVPEPTWGMVR
jgi:GntR family transcriptional repressor for pyruvate dehydrogenase complex